MFLGSWKIILCSSSFLFRPGLEFFNPGFQYLISSVGDCMTIETPTVEILTPMVSNFSGLIL